MVDIVLEIVRAAVLLGIVLFLVQAGQSRFKLSRTGWKAIVVGFCLLLFGSLLDITDNFESLNSLVVVGDTEVEAFLEKFVGFLGGFCVLALGLIRWVPSVKRLSDEVSQRRHVESALREQTESARLLHKIAVAANEASDAEDAIQVCLDEVCAYTGWPIGHAYIRADDGTGELAPTELWHLDDPDRFAIFRQVTEAIRFAPGIGLPGRVLVSGEPVWIVDVTKDANCSRTKMATDIGVKAGFAFPVLIGSKVAAVVEFFSPEVAEPDEHVIEIMAQIGTQLGRALERMFADEALREAHDTLERRVIERTVDLESEIVERKRAAAALCESEQRFKDFSDAASDWIWEMGPDLRFTYVSSRVFEVLRLMPSHFLDNTLEEVTRVVEPDENWRGRLDDLKRHRPFRDFRYRMQLPDGSVRCIDLSGKPVFDADGEFRGYRGCGADVTIRVEAALHATKAQSQLVDAIESISDGFALYDADDRLVLCNDPFRRQFPDVADLMVPGTSFEEILCATVAASQGPADGRSIREQALEYMERHRSRAGTFEQQLGDNRWFQVSERRTSDGGTVSIHTDITKLKQAETALRESEARVRMIVENIADGIVTIDEYGVIQSFNAAAERIFGYEASEVLGSNVNVLMPEPHHGNHDRYFENYMKTGEGTLINGDPRELSGQRKDGAVFPLELLVRETLAGDNRCFIGTLRDISAKKLDEDRMRESQRLEAIGQLSGGVAHDFNNILMVIGGFAARALANIDRRERLEQSLDEVIKSTERGTTLTRQLLMFGRREVLERRVIRLGDQLREAESLLRPLLGEAVELKIEISAEKTCVETDPGQLYQAIVNLAINARDAMPSGGALIITSETSELDSEVLSRHPNAQPGAYARIMVKDQGTGMDDDTLLRMFEPYFTTKEQGKGTGLGLAMVYGFVTQSKGIIDVTSTLGEGTEFYIYLPVVEGMTANTEVEQKESYTAQNETVLLAEDDSALRLLIRETLDDLGYAVLEAGDGLEALEVDEECGDTIDLLLTDVVMPGLGGFDLARALQQSRPDVKVVFMSGYPARGDLKRVDIPADTPFLQKPVDPQRLARCIREVLDTGRFGDWGGGGIEFGSNG